ncbi:MAG: hypothetical protein JNK49_04865 [Planctomycetes bacterium]|nr:hypothetical protein [Planctomycetota bacterium]
MRTLFAVLLLAIPAVAQLTVITPDPSGPLNLDRPFPGGTGRYQQWYSANELAAGFGSPVRIERLEFFAGSNAQNATTIDMEVTMAHGPALGLGSTFAANFLSPPVVVWPRGNLQLTAGAAGSVVLTVPFSTRFTWDRTRPVVVDIKIFGNSRNGQPFTYDFQGTASGQGSTGRNYVQGSPSATTGTVQVGWGLRTRITARPGVVVDFGFGCAGGGNVVPRNASLNVPYPGITWNNQLTGAASQALAIFAIGLTSTTTTTSPPVALPADIGVLFGMAPLNCNLLVDLGAVLSATTVGGGPGSGIASMPLVMPPVTWYIGTSFFTQWLVLDANAPNGVLAASQGVWAIVAPVGG